MAMGLLYSYFNQSANKNVSNSIVETSLFGTGLGTLVIPANFMKSGRGIKIKMRGFFSRASGNITVRFKLGTTTIVATATASSGVGTNAGFEIDVLCAVRTVGVSGTVIAQGKFVNLNNGNILQMVDLADDIIDTTVANTIDITIQFSVANVGNTITATNCIVEMFE